MATIGTSYAATIAANYIVSNDEDLNNAITELASGSKFSNPGSDPGGLSISESLQARIQQLNVAVSGAQDVVSYAQTADGYLSTLSNITSTLAELTQNLTNGAFSSSDRANYAIEAAALTGEFASIYENAEFNNVSLFSGTAATCNIVVAIDASGTTDSLTTSNVATVVSDVLNTILTIYTGGSSSSLTDNTVATSYITSIEDALSSLSTQRGVISANISKFNFYISNLNTQSQNAQQAYSTITDPNVAILSTRISTDSILIQAATAVLAQANSTQDSVLTLLR